MNSIWNRPPHPQKPHGALPPESSVLCCDASPSMYELCGFIRPKIFLARAAVRAYAQAKIDRNEQDEVALTVFDCEAQTIMPCTDDIPALFRAVKEYTILGGGTSIETGLSTALQALRDSPYARRIVLLTDGIEESGSAIRLLPQIRRENVVVDAVWIGRGQRPGVLDQLAFSTGGTVSLVDQITALPRRFAQLAHEKKGSSHGYQRRHLPAQIFRHTISPRSGPPCG